MTVKSYPIHEIYGPTIQGEGPLIGTPTMFGRVSGCNDDCWWCDTKYAVNPKYEGWQRIMMTAEEICTKLMSLSHIRHVTISGGNPALFVDYELFETLHQYYYSATLETQGNIRIPHMALKHIAFKYLVISPKPPSSGMHKRMNSESVAHMINVRKDFGLATYLKYVIFNDEDLTWAEEFDKSLHTNPTERCLSVGTTRNDLEHKDLVEHILACTDGLVDRVLKGQVHYFSNARILPQLHALIWGRQRGV